MKIDEKKFQVRDRAVSVSEYPYLGDCRKIGKFEQEQGGVGGRWATSRCWLVVPSTINKESWLVQNTKLLPQRLETINRTIRGGGGTGVSPDLQISRQFEIGSPESNASIYEYRW